MSSILTPLIPPPMTVLPASTAYRTLIGMGGLALASAVVTSVELALLMLGGALLVSGAIVVFSLRGVRSDDRMVSGFVFGVYLLLGLLAIIDAGESMHLVGSLTTAVSALMCIGGMFRAAAGLLARGPRWVGMTISGCISLALGTLLSVAVWPAASLSLLGAALGIEIGLHGLLGARAARGGYRSTDTLEAEEPTDLLLY